MTRIGAAPSVQRGAKDPQAWETLEKSLQDVYRTLNAIGYGDPADGDVVGNHDAVWLVYTTNAVANTDDTRRHRLRRVPVGFIQVERPNRTGETPNSGQLYWGTGPSSNVDSVTLRCTTASKAVYAILF